MISPSPEFPVTKVGMAYRKRDKPLRTYGRQPSTTIEASASKKRKTTHEPSPLSKPSDIYEKAAESQEQRSSAAMVATTTKLPESASKLAEGPVAPTEKKGSILSFFKPLPSKNLVAKKEKHEDEEDSRPSKPSPKRRKRASRLLRLRPTPSADDYCEEKENQKPSNEKDGTSAIEKPPIHASNPKAAPSIQTTLNISSRAAFEECKLCNTVWNPSFADDVKYHKRRHAAVLRRRHSDRAAEGLR